VRLSADKCGSERVIFSRQIDLENQLVTQNGLGGAGCCPTLRGYMGRGDAKRSGVANAILPA
jgi:hypothetical protein